MKYFRKDKNKLNSIKINIYDFLQYGLVNSPKLNCLSDRKTVKIFKNLHV